MPILHTLRLKNRLTQHGMPDDQAQDFVDELDDALTTAVSAQVATKADIVELRGEMTTSLESLRGDVKGDIKTLRWMGATLLTLVLILLGLVFNQQQRLATVESTTGQRLTAIETTLDQLTTTTRQLRGAVEALATTHPVERPDQQR